MPGLEPELGADEVELGALRLLERGVRRRVVAAAVGHLRLEDEGVEVVGEVVVVADRGPVAGQAVEPTLDARLRRRCCGRTARARRVRTAVRIASTSARGERRTPDRPRSAPTAKACVSADSRSQPSCCGDVELTGDVGLRGPELARVPDQPAQRVGGAEHDERTVERTCHGAVPRLQPDGEVAADEGANRLGEPVRDTGRRHRRAGGRLGHWCSLVKVSCETLM